MATWGFQAGTTASTFTHGAQGKNVPYLMSRVIDYTAFTVGSTDVVQALMIPDNTAVLLAGVEVLTADSAGNSGTIALGAFSGIASGGFVAAAAPTTVGQMTTVTVPASGFTNEGTGKHDTIDVTHATGSVNGIIRVWALVCDLNGLPNTQPVAPTTVAVLS